MKSLFTLPIILFGMALISNVTLPVPASMLLLGCSLIGLAGLVKNIKLMQRPAKPHREAVGKTAPSL